ncbi:MAG TPA: hypothetical protein VJP03_01725 [Actinomycetota bacterium]|nr:hypothetical protein [Actinomycetota bacterium]
MHRPRFSTTFSGAFSGAFSSAFSGAFSGAIACACVAFALAACTGDAEPDAPSTTAPVTAISGTGPTASPTPPALPDEPLATRGPVAPDCVHGWMTPPRDAHRYAEPLRVIRRATGVEGPLEVVDLRFFEGPESPPSDKGYLLDIRRWYVKAFAKHDLSFQGRFLVESREFGTGLVAVAPYDTNGFRSPDWVGFQFASGDPEARVYPRLPGTWAGVPYDFVRGGAGLQIPGLPDEVVGCLSAT